MQLLIYIERTSPLPVSPHEAKADGEGWCSIVTFKGLWADMLAKQFVEFVVFHVQGVLESNDALLIEFYWGPLAC